MATKVVPDQGLRQFQKLVGLMKKLPDWDKHSKYNKIIEDLSTNTSKEAQDVRDIMWRMLRAEHKAIKDKKQLL